MALLRNGGGRRICDERHQVTSLSSALVIGKQNGFGEPLVSEESDSLATRALSRLLAGCGGPVEEAAIGSRVAGSRLVAFQPTARRSTQSLAVALRDGDRSLVTASSDYVYVLAKSGVNARTGNGSLAAAQRLVAYARRIDRSVRAAISSELRHYGELRQARADVTELLQMDRCKLHSALLVEDYWSHLAIQRSVDVLCGFLPQGSPLLRLIDAVGTSNDHGALTLLRWLELNRDYNSTGKALSLHVNTVRYRVSRAERLFGLDLADRRQLALAQLCSLLVLGQVAEVEPNCQCSASALSVHRQ